MLKIEDGVCWISLGEEVVSLVEFDDSSAKAGVGKKSRKIECGVVRIGGHHGTSSTPIRMCDQDCFGPVKGRGESASRRFEQSIPYCLIGNTYFASLPWRRP
jgi:hypothetical protein